MRRRAVGLALAALLVAGTAGADPFEFGGDDTISQYTWDGTFGIFSFSNNPGDSTPGTVNTDDDGVGVLGADVTLDIILDTSSFDPTTDNVKNASFVGGATVADLAFISGGTPLLTFDISYIDVTGATRQSAITGDPDGSISLGSAAVEATSSLLTVSGGTLASQVGGVGTEARLSLLISTLTPAIITKGDFSGYLGQDFLSGVGAAPVTSLKWDLSIITAPEPGTAALFGSALLGLAAWGRLRGRRSR